MPQWRGHRCGHVLRKPVLPVTRRLTRGPDPRKASVSEGGKGSHTPGKGEQKQDSGCHGSPLGGLVQSGGHKKGSSSPEE